VTADELKTMLTDLVVDATPRRPRGSDETVQLGDEILVDVIAFCNGKIVPFSAHQRTRFILTDDVIAQGFAAGLIGTRVGSHANVQVTLGEDHPVPELRGKRAVYGVHVHSASEVAFLVDEQARLTVAGITDLTAAMEQLARAALAARDAEARHHVLSAALNELAARAKVKVTPAMIDYTIGQRWQAEEGRFLTGLGVKPEDREEALKAWLECAPLREETRRQLEHQLVLGAIAERDGQTLTPQEFANELAALAKNLGADNKTLASQLVGDPAAATDIACRLNMQKAVDYVATRIQVTAKATA
jgi:trigger factor